MTRKAGLVGAGHISRFHVQALRRLPGVEIVGVTDLDQSRSARFAAETGVASFPSLRALKDAGAQVIHVLTPPAAHAPVAFEALALGCDLFVEKPLATSAEDCDRIERMALEHGRVVCAGHSLLFDPFVQRALALVRSGAIGDVLTFEHYRGQNPQAYAHAALSADQRRGGYPFRDIGIHALYLAEAFVGPIADVQAWPAASGRGDCNLWVDEWRVLARCERGTAQVHLSWNVRPQQNYFIVQGTRGVVRADLFGMTVTLRRQRRVPEHLSRVMNSVGEGCGMAVQAAGSVARVATKKLRQFHGLQALVAEFYRCLEAGREAPVTPANARRVVFWTEAVAQLGDDMRDRWIDGAASRTLRANTLVTGGSGFIGRHLVRRLLREGTPVRLLVRRPPAPELARHPLVEIVIGDLADAAAVDRAVDGVHTVYHLGATMRGGSADFDRGTVVGTRNVVDSCTKHAVGRLVYMSSLAVIDADVGANGPVTESSALERRVADRGHYTRAKLEAEEIVLQAAARNGLRAVLLRPGEVVGPDKPLMTAGVAQQAGGALIVLGNGRVRLPLVHVADVADALLAAAVAPLENGVILHLVEDCAVTQNDIIAHYLSSSVRRQRVLKVPLPIVLGLAAVVEWLAKRTIGTAPIGPRRIRAATASRRYDCRRAAALLGWKPSAGVASVFSPARERESPLVGTFEVAGADRAAIV